MRGPSGKSRYGFPHLIGEDKEKVRVGTLLAQRTAEAVGLFEEQAKPSITEQPKWKKDNDSVSMYNLDEFQAFKESPNFEFVDLVQCE